MSKFPKTILVIGLLIIASPCMAQEDMHCAPSAGYLANDMHVQQYRPRQQMIYADAMGSFIGQGIADSQVRRSNLPSLIAQ